MSEYWLAAIGAVLTILLLTVNYLVAERLDERDALADRAPSDAEPTEQQRDIGPKETR